MNSSFRGYVSEYADKRNMSMPQAYRELMELGIIASDIDIKTFTPTKEPAKELHEMITMDSEEVTKNPRE